MKIKREKIIMFRASTLEKKIIERAAGSAGMTTAEFCRQAALGREVSARLTTQEIEAYKMLSVTKLNFTRISNLIKARQDISAEVRNVIELINNQLDKFQ